MYILLKVPEINFIDYQCVYKLFNLEHYIVIITDVCENVNRIFK